MPFLKTLGCPAFAPRRGAAPLAIRKKDLALLIFLRFSQAAHTRARLATLLWSNSTDTRARHSLTQALSRLNRLLGPGALAHDSLSVRLALRIPCDLDAEDVRHGAGMRFLDGFEPGEGAEDFMEWADRTRDALVREWSAALDRRGEDAERRADAAEALAAAEQALEVDPYSERALRRVMRSLAALGEAHQARFRCDRFGGWLHEETGARLQAETLALRSLLVGGLPPAATAGSRAHDPSPAPPTEIDRAAPPMRESADEPRDAVAHTLAAAVDMTVAISPRESPWKRWATPVLAVGASLVAAIILLATQQPQPPALYATPSSSPPCRAGFAVARFLGESYPDNVPVAPGERFVKSWTLKNTGSCTWGLRFTLRLENFSSLPLSAGNARLRLPREVPPGDTVTLQIPMAAPVQPGLYREDWSLRDGEDAAVTVSSSRTIWAKVFVPPAESAACTADNAVARFVREDVPDNTVVAPGAAFVKRWVLRNAGMCSWPASFALLRVGGDGPGLARTARIPLPRPVQPGGEVALRVPMQAPRKPGTFREEWRFATADGDSVRVSGSRTLWAQVRVSGGP